MSCFDEIKNELIKFGVKITNKEMDEIISILCDDRDAKSKAILALRINNSSETIHEILKAHKIDQNNSPQFTKLYLANGVDEGFHRLIAKNLESEKEEIEYHQLRKKFAKTLAGIKNAYPDIEISIFMLEAAELQYLTKTIDEKGLYDLLKSLFEVVKSNETARSILPAQVSTKVTPT